MKKLLLATAAALAIFASPAAALTIDKISFPTEESVVVLLSAIPEHTTLVTCVLSDLDGKNVAVQIDGFPDIVDQMTFRGVVDDPEADGNAENITCWLDHNHSTKVARWLMLDIPPQTRADQAGGITDLPKE
jgi:hypothetical protein